MVFRGFLGGRQFTQGTAFLALLAVAATAHAQYGRVAESSGAQVVRPVAASRPCRGCQQPRCCCPAPVVCPPGVSPSGPAPVVTPDQLYPSTPPDSAAPTYPSPTYPSPSATDPLGTGPSPALDTFAQADSSFGSGLAYGAGEGAYGGARGVPYMMADNFGGGSSVSILPVAESFSFSASGFIVDGSPGGFDSTIVYETTGGPANDFFSQGIGRDTNGDGFADTFSVSEPVPPTDAPLPGAPGSIFLGGEARTDASPYDNGDTWFINYAFATYQEVIVPVSPGGGILVGRQKIAENNSPIPRDRLLFNYSSFKNVPLLASRPSVNRFTLGFEKTFLGGDASLELRAPMAATVSSNVMLDGTTGTGNGEFGDLMLTLKFLLWETDTLAIAAGMGLTLPTADDTRVFLTRDWEFARVRNRSVHLMPYVGWILVPSERWFWQGFFQLDIDSNGNPVDTNLNNTQLARSGVLHDATYLYTDVGMGYWLYESNARNQIVTGIAPMVELHYNCSLNSTDFVEAGPVRVGQRKGDVQVLNFVVGTSVRMAGQSVLQVGYSAPIGNSVDHQFDGELRAMFNKFF